MSAEIAVKKRGRPKKVLTEVEVEIEETPTRTATRKATKAAITAKKPSSAKKTAKVDDVKSSLPQKPKTSVLEEVQKLEMLKERKNPTSKSATSSAHSSSTQPTTASNRPVETPPLTKAQSSETSSAGAVAKASTSESKILDEVKILLKTPGSADKIEGTSKEAIGETKGATNTVSTTEREKAANTTPQEAAVSATSIPKIEESTMPKSTKEQPLPIKSTSPTANVKAESRPKVPITELNSKIVSDISARGGARITPTGKPGQLPENYKPFARTITKTIIALPILLVTSYVLYERLIQGEEQKKLVRFPDMSGLQSGQKQEASKASKPTSATN